MQQGNTPGCYSNEGPPDWLSVPRAVPGEARERTLDPESYKRPLCASGLRNFSQFPTLSSSSLQPLLSSCSSCLRSSFPSNPLPPTTVCQGVGPSILFHTQGSLRGCLSLSLYFPDWCIDFFLLRSSASSHLTNPGCSFRVGPRRTVVLVICTDLSSCFASHPRCPWPQPRH